MTTKLSTNILDIGVFFENFEIMRASTNRFTLRDDDSRWRADENLFIGMASFLFRVVAVSFLFILWLTLFLFYSVNDKGEFRIGFFELFDGTDAFAATVLLFCRQSENFRSRPCVRRQDFLTELAHPCDVSGDAAFVLMLKQKSQELLGEIEAVVHEQHQPLVREFMCEG